jgi:hypothetical protein
MSEESYIFAFFPYLKTTKPVHYRGITIRGTDDLTDLPSDAISHFEKLRTMFFLRDHLRIKKMVYAFHKYTDELTASEFTEKLIEFQNLACFCYSTPHPTSGEPFLRYEHSSLFLLQPKQIYEGLIRNEHNVEILPEAQNLKVNKRKEVDGYEGFLNNNTHFWVTEGSRIFPPTVDLVLNISQDLSIEFGHHFPQSESYRPLIEYFSTKIENNSFSDRILTALIWYNRSLRNDIDESEALINLAIAFESLLDLDRSDKLTARFKEAVGLLAGDINRLDSWLTQFYDARSEIVHKGRSSRLMFIPTNDPKNDKKSELEYRSLVSYGRQIFRICITTIITGAHLAQNLNLPSMLVTNQERFERICQTLGEKDKTPVERLLATSQDVADTDKYRFVPEKGLKIDQMIGTAKLIIKQFLETNLIDDHELSKLMGEFISLDVKNHHYEALNLINVLQSKMKTKREFKTVLQSTLHTIVASLLDTIWGYTFIYFYQLENKKNKSDQA